MWKPTQFIGVACFGLLVSALPADPNDNDWGCLTSQRSYEDAAESFTSASSSFVVISTYTYVKTVTLSDVPHTTLCDGRTRALESYQYTTSTDVTTREPRTIINYPTYTAPSPTCEIAETACTAIKEDFWSSFDKWLSTNQDPTPAPSPRGTYCNTIETSTSETWTPAPEPTLDPACSRKPDNCMISVAGSKTLYYWPVTTVSGDFCLQNGSTITPEPTITGVPNTAVVDGHTFTSPTNYLSIDHAYAVIYEGYKHISRCGAGGVFPEHENIVVPITETISSRMLGVEPSHAAAINFEHLNQPIPAPVYDRFRCRGGLHTCDKDPVIYDEGDYKPILQIPTEILNLEDEWRSVGCTYTVGGSALSWQVTPVPLQTPPPRPF